MRGILLTLPTSQTVYMGEEATDRKNGPGVQLHLQAFGTYGLLIGVFQILPLTQILTMKTDWLFNHNTGEC